MYNRHSMHGYFGQWQGTYIIFTNAKMQRCPLWLQVSRSLRTGFDVRPVVVNVLVEIATGKSPTSKFFAPVDALKAISAETC